MSAMICNQCNCTVGLLSSNCVCDCHGYTRLQDKRKNRDKGLQGNQEVDNYQTHMELLKKYYQSTIAPKPLPDIDKYQQQIGHQVGKTYDVEELISKANGSSGLTGDEVDAIRQMLPDLQHIHTLVDNLKKMNELWEDMEAVIEWHKRIKGL